MFKKIFILLFIILNISTWFASDTSETSDTSEISDDTVKIDSIIYEWFLSNETIININWENFDKCSTLTVNSKPINIITKNNNLITYKYIDWNVSKWNVNIKCSTFAVEKNFIFPIIKSVNVDYDNSMRIYEVFWENFINWTTVNLWNWTQIWIDSLSEVSIFWHIEESNDDKNVYLTYNNLKSNLFETDFKTPHITHIEAKQWLSPWNKIIIHWNNLKWDINSYILIWDFQDKTYKYNYNNNTIEYTLPELYWKNNIKFVWKWVSSNSIELNITWNRPIITNAYTKWEYIDDEYKNVLYITWKNLYSDNSSIVIRNNSNTYAPTSIDDELIKISDFMVNEWNNLISLYINWVYSNVFNLYESQKVPFIANIIKYPAEWEYRTYDVSFWNLLWPSEKIYFNWSKVNAFACTTTNCKIQLSSSDIKWYFSLEKYNWDLTIPEYFDYSDEEYPVIYDMSINWELKSWTKFKITWKNLDNSEVNITNLTNLEEIESTSESISWYISIDYNPNETTQVSISKYWKTQSLNFIWNEIKQGKYQWYWYISNIKNQDWKSIIKQWSTIIINWYWFYNWIKAYIGDTSYNVTYKNTNQVSLTLPTNLNEWVNAITFKNGFWNSWNEYNIYVYPKNYWNSIKISKDQTNTQDIIVNQEYSDEFLYSLKIDNFSENIYIKELYFKIKNYTKEKDFWNFKIKLWGQDLWEINADSQWIIKFNDIILNSDFWWSILSIYKTTPFYYSWNYEIELNKINAYYRDSSTPIPSFNQVDTTYSLNILNDKNQLCIDSSSDNSNCNSDILSQNPTQSTTNSSQVKTNENTTNPLTSTKQSIYEKIDTITQKYIESNNSKSLEEQLNNYNTFRLKIKSVISKNNNSPSKIYLEYFYDKINAKYMKVFKEYVLSKK